MVHTHLPANCWMRKQLPNIKQDFSQNHIPSEFSATQTNNLVCPKIPPQTKLVFTTDPAEPPECLTLKYQNQYQIDVRHLVYISPVCQM